MKILSGIIQHFSRSKKTKGTSRKKKFQNISLEFRHRGKLIYSVKLDQLEESWRIGKAADNDCVIPPDDRCAAQYHAVLNLKDHLFISALNDNKLYFHGKAVKSCNLKINDRVAIGDCELFLKKSQVVSNEIQKYHRLEFCSRYRKGETIDLNKDLFRIGSNPENELCIENELISNFHAEIRLDETGSAWLHDLNSCNGSFVNGEHLGRQERLLKDSDLITFAYIELVFLDKAIYHPRLQLFKKLSVLVITVLIIALFSFLVYTLTPEASALMSVAKEQIKNADFDAAEETLHNLPEAKNGENMLDEHTRMLGDIARFRKSLHQWNQFKENIADEDWTEAMRYYANLDTSARNQWAWNESQTDALIELIQNTKNLLDVCNENQRTLYNISYDPTIYRKRLAEIAKFDVSLTGNEEEWEKTLKNRFIEQKDALEKNARIEEKLEETLNRMRTGELSIAEGLEEFSRQQKDCVGEILFTILSRISFMNDLKHDDDIIRKSQENFCALKLNEQENTNQFVTNEEEAYNDHYRDLYRKLRTRFQNIQESKDELKLLLFNLKQAGFNGSQRPVFLNSLLSENEIITALGPGCLQYVSGSGHGVPYVNSYDRIFGRKIFRNLILQEMDPDNAFLDDELLKNLIFIPDIIKTGILFKAVQECRTWLSVPEKQWMLNGEIRKLADDLESMLKYRAQILAIIRKNIGKPGTRQYFVCKTVIMYLTTATEISATDRENFRKEWKEYCKRISHLQTLRQSADKTEAQKAEQILKELEIPGNRVY